MKRMALWAVMTLAATALVRAGEVTSVYTRLDYDRGCQTLSQTEEGGSILLRCEGFQGYPVYYSEGDLRVTMKYGFVSDDSALAWESFSPWNSVNTTLEWRLDNGKPYATILRWFIDNVNPNTGSADEASRGQVLVVSTVARDGVSDSCMVGLVDARSNPKANEIARNVADNVAKSFQCGRDSVRYYGKQGPYAPGAD